MREIEAKKVIDAVADLCRRANYELPDDVVAALEQAVASESSPLGKRLLQSILRNASIARKGKFPICQDCGLAVFFVEMGREVRIEGMTLEQALTVGTRKGYSENYLRKSVVRDPLRRENTGDNTPPCVHIRQVEGDKLWVRFMPKGSGSENMSSCVMLSPSDGADAVRRIVVECVDAAGAKSCPPITVGVGLGGSFEECAKLAKLALFRKTGSRHKDAFYDGLERQILEDVNSLGIGPLGFGGTTTALAVHIEAAPCHIASLPVAVNLQCHAARRAEVIL
ncbi:MAG TPA: fumarate hydratase [bacterium]|nr:fumarate hydratase [bacterium]